MRTNIIGVNPDLTHDCPDEQVLLDYLAGELYSAAARSVERHLKICTDCDLRADQLSEDFADVERAIGTELPLPPLRLAAARTRLQQRQEAYEANRAERRRGAPWAGIAVAAAVLVLLAGAASQLFDSGGEPALAVGQVLSRAQESMPRYESRPSMARYQVEFAQLEPEAVVRNHELVIWTDPSIGAYASRLEDSEGSLRHQVWRRAAERPVFAYDSVAGGALIRINRSDRAQESTLLTSIGSGLDCDALASGFVRWLEGRDWQPVQVSNDFALLASDDAAMQLERSGGVLLVTAHRQVGELRAEVTLTLGAESYEPHSLKIHFSGPRGEATVTLVQHEVRFIAASHLDTSVFEARAPSARVARVRPVPQLQSGPTSVGPDSRTVEARLRYALHEAAACLGEPVEVVLDETGKFVVRGIVGTSEMKARVLMELENSGLADSVSMDILTRAEAVANAEARIHDQGASVPPAIRHSSPSGGRGPVQSIPLTTDLTAYFGAGNLSHPQISVGEELSAFTQGAVDRAEVLLQIAWALRRLAERYGQESGDNVSPEAAALVREMAQDHLSGIAAAVRESADWMLPTLDAVASRRGVEVEVPRAVPQPPEAAKHWPDSVLSLFGSVDTIHKHTLALLTVRLDFQDVPKTARGQDRAADVDRILRQLLESHRTISLEVIRTTEEFAAISAPVSATPLAWGSQR